MTVTNIASSGSISVNYIKEHIKAFLETLILHMPRTHGTIESCFLIGGAKSIMRVRQI